MYSNQCFCDSLSYVLENRGSGHVVVCVDVPRDVLPDAFYRDDLDWAVWKKAHGYRLWSVSPLRRFGQRVLDDLDELVPEGVVRLYRLMKPKEKN